MVAGILALQGCIEPHLRLLRKAGHDALLVKTPEDLKKIERIILPGGESTTMLRLLDRGAMFEPLKEFCAQRPVWGVCAGAILLAKKVSHPEQVSLGLIDVEAIRNHYGCQLASFSADVTLELAGEAHTLRGDFIRAPLLKALDEGVIVSGTIEGGIPVCFQQKNVLVSSFHAELGDDARLHEYFLGM